ncbi:AraC family transcriptional regulator ligand-binding domain-containing protein [Maricaulis sp. D1M11]|uniref:AraC family transcriptional regulator n=1 Tax=Maricaulis sp. D1M11 TaxID=3076117 RepID=UPI0039B6B076
MDHISTLFIQKLVTLVSSTSSHADRDWLIPTGLAPGDPGAWPGMIAAEAFFELLEQLAQHRPDGRGLGVRLGRLMRCDDYGSFGLAFKSAPDLLGSFRRVERYGQVVTNVANYRVEPGATATFMAIDPGRDTRLGQRMTNELAVAAGVGLCREVSCEPFTPSAVCFSHERPGTLDIFEQHFQCPLHFGADRDGFEIAKQDLQVGNRLGDQGLARFFDAHLDRELAEFVVETGLDHEVCLEISRALSEGVPSIGEVAARLGMSARTLQRRLAQDGHVYQDLVETTRRRLAERLLRQTDYALAEIAFLTGYSEQSTFTRAFKRLSGQTPARYRREGVTL